MPPTFLVAPDSFKGSLTASDAASIITRAIRSVVSGAKIIQIPIADGGEGTVETLVSTSLGYFIESEVMNAYGGRDIVPWGILGGSQTAVLEIASCAGLPNTPIKKRDPKFTTTYGLGELIKEAIKEHCSEILIGLGGSATNDGGAGMAQALGLRLLDRHGKEIERGGAALIHLHSIDYSKKDSRLNKKRFTGMCDVDISLLGPNGATMMFAKQKGASDEDLNLLEDALANYTEVIRRDSGIDVASIPGSGAAGGLGAGLLAFLNADLRTGIDFILDRVEFDKHCALSDFIITGEGKIDDQSKHGKALSGITARAKRFKRPVIAFAGIVDEQDTKLKKALHVDAMYCITPENQSENEAIQNAARNLEARVKEIIRSIVASI